MSGRDATGFNVTPFPPLTLPASAAGAALAEEARGGKRSTCPYLVKPGVVQWCCSRHPTLIHVLHG
jgi:hypothetical protein